MVTSVGCLTPEVIDLFAEILSRARELRTAEGMLGTAERDGRTLTLENPRVDARLDGLMSRFATAVEEGGLTVDRRSAMVAGVPTGVVARLSIGLTEQEYLAIARQTAGLLEPPAVGQAARVSAAGTRPRARFSDLHPDDQMFVGSIMRAEGLEPTSHREVADRLAAFFTLVPVPRPERERAALVRELQHAGVSRYGAERLATTLRDGRPPRSGRGARGRGPHGDDGPAA